MHSGHTIQTVSLWSGHLQEPSRGQQPQQASQGTLVLCLRGEAEPLAATTI